MSKKIIGIIHDHNIEMNLIFLYLKSDIFGLLFRGDGATIFQNYTVENINFWGKYPSNCIMNCLFTGSLGVENHVSGDEQEIPQKTT